MRLSTLPPTYTEPVPVISPFPGCWVTNPSPDTRTPEQIAEDYYKKTDLFSQPLKKKVKCAVPDVPGIYTKRVTYRFTYCSYMMEIEQCDGGLIIIDLENGQPGYIRVFENAPMEWAEGEHLFIADAGTSWSRGILEFLNTHGLPWEKPTELTLS